MRQSGLINNFSESNGSMPSLDSERSLSVIRRWWWYVREEEHLA